MLGCEDDLPEDLGGHLGELCICVTTIFVLLGKFCVIEAAECAEEGIRVCQSFSGMERYTACLLLLQAHILKSAGKQGSLFFAHQALAEFKKLDSSLRTVRENGIGDAQTLLGLHKIRDIESEEVDTPRFKSIEASFEEGQMYLQLKNENTYFTDAMAHYKSAENRFGVARALVH
jgi:hypothetical protein